jgi:hypothetical protein
MNSSIIGRITRGDEASCEVFACIDGFYNRQRLYQSLRYLSPLEFEPRISDS